MTLFWNKNSLETPPLDIAMVPFIQILIGTINYFINLGITQNKLLQSKCPIKYFP